MSSGSDTPAPTGRPSPNLLWVVFFLSGAAALIYEAAWQRQFMLLFGTAAPATAAVLGAYFAGLGIGSFLLGRVATQWRQPLKVYAVLELVTAAGALLVAPILSLYALFYPGLFAAFQSAGLSFSAVKAVLAFLAIAIPTMAMGGTLPVLTQLFENSRSRLGEQAGWLYLLNTAGAAAGVLSFPFLLSAAGMQRSVWLCAGLNLLIAAAAFILGKGMARDPAPPESGPRSPKTNPPPKSKPHQTRRRSAGAGPWLGLAFASGFVTFALQVTWSRAFGLIHENSGHSFSLIVALFIVAIAGGAQLARVMLRRKWPPGKAIGMAWLAGGILTLPGPMIFFRMSDGLKAAAEGPAVTLPLAGIALVVIFLPVLFLSAGLPLAIQGAADASSRPAGALTGSLLAWNIAGSVLGALAAGFLFPYFPGMWKAIAVTATVALVIAGFLTGGGGQKGRMAGALCLICGAVVALTLDLPRTRVDAARGESLLDLSEGSFGVVAVVRDGDSLRLKLNNHYTLGGTLATGDERMQAHIPLLLHPRPQSVAFLGYGTGITAGGSTFHEPSAADDAAAGYLVTALELVPEVVHRAHYHGFDDTSFHVQPWARVIIEDARNFLRGTAQQFDVIVGDLVVPWRHGEGALYTLEHFAAARDRLNPGGLYCAWLPLFQLGEEDFQCIARTFLEIFPRTFVWRGDFSPFQPALALIGYADGDWNPHTVASRLQTMKPDPSNPQLKHSPAFWMHFVGVLNRPPAESGRAPLNTEDLPLVELRWRRPPPFAGRDFKTWENRLRDESADTLRPALPPDALTGWECGRLMSEFTLLLVENNRPAAESTLRKLRERLGAEAARAVFGE